MFIRKIWGIYLTHFLNYFKKVNLVNLSQISLLNMLLLVQNVNLFCVYLKRMGAIDQFQYITTS